jgi:hypothetical protein
MIRPLQKYGVVFVLFLSACAMTRIVSVWRDPNYRGPPLRKVLVCSLSRDEVVRRQIEDAFVAALQSDDVSGTQCYRVLPPGRPTAQQVREVAQNEGQDGIIMTLPARTTVTPVYEAGPGWGYGPGPGWGPFYDAWGYDWDTVYGPGYIATQTQVSLQAKAYSTEPPGRLIWAATSETFDPSSVRSLVARIVPKLIGSMARSGILPSNPSGGGESSKRQPDLSVR